MFSQGRLTCKDCLKTHYNMAWSSRTHPGSFFCIPAWLTSTDKKKKKETLQEDKKKHHKSSSFVRRLSIPLVQTVPFFPFILLIHLCTKEGKNTPFQVLTWFQLFAAYKEKNKLNPNNFQIQKPKRTRTGTLRIQLSTGGWESIVGKEVA